MSEDLEQQSIRGREAEQLLANRLFRQAFERVEEHIENRAHSTRDTDEAACAKVIQAKQILAGIRREIERVVQEGEVARIQLREIENRRGLKFRR